MCRWTRIRAARQTASLPHSAAWENTAHNADPAGPWATQGLQRKKRNKTPWKNPPAPDGNPVRRGALHGSVLPPQQEDKGLQRLRVRFSSLFFFSLFSFFYLDFPSVVSVSGMLSAKHPQNFSLRRVPSKAIEDWHSRQTGFLRPSTPHLPKPVSRLFPEDPSPQHLVPTLVCNRKVLNCRTFRAGSLGLNLVLPGEVIPCLTSRGRKNPGVTRTPGIPHVGRKGAFQGPPAPGCGS